MANEQPENKENKFAVYAVRKNEPTPLIQTGLPFKRLIDDIVVPFESDEVFFLDGAPVKATDLDRIKIIRQTDFFSSALGDLHYGMRRGESKRQEFYAKQYHVRLEAVLRESGEDVTAQVIEAFRTVIKPKLKDYVPNKEALTRCCGQDFS